MPLLQFGEYKPDVSDYEAQATKNILNVIPRGDGYGPFGSFAASTQALPATCRGGFYALKSDGSVQMFAGTSTGLYRLNNTDLISATNRWDQCHMNSYAQWLAAQMTLDALTRSGLIP